jgi:hypothetical protein
MRITKRQLRRIIKEERQRDLPIEFYTDEMLMSEGLLDFIGGLFAKLTGFFKDLTGATDDKASDVSSSVGSSADADVVSLASNAGREDVEGIDDLDLEEEEDQTIYFSALSAPARTAAEEALEYLGKTDSVESWTPESESDEDVKAWEDANGDAATGIWEAWGTSKGWLQHFSKRGIKQAKPQEASADDPATAIKFLLASAEQNIGIWDTAEHMKGVDGVSDAWGKVTAKATSIGEKIAADGKDEQKDAEADVKEWITLRRWVGSQVIHEGKRSGRMKITKGHLRRIIQEALSRDAQDLEPRLVAVWEQVSADTLQALGGRASWEDIADEVMASGYSIDPDLIESINLLPFDQQQALFQKTFGAGRRY